MKRTLINLIWIEKVAMGMSINIVACVGLQNTGKKVQRDVCPPDERFKKFRTIRKSHGEVDVCSDLRENYIYKFEKFAWFRVGHRESNYNNWLNQLATLVGFDCRNPDSNKPGPFRELFWQVSYDVTFGPAVVIKLCIDFYIWRERAASLGDEEFMQTYNLLVEILDFASVNGAFWYEAS